MSLSEDTSEHSDDEYYGGECEKIAGEEDEEGAGHASAHGGEVSKSDSSPLSPDHITLTPAQARRCHRIMSNFRYAYTHTLSNLVYAYLTSLLSFL